MNILNITAEQACTWKRTWELYRQGIINVNTIIYQRPYVNDLIPEKMYSEETSKIKFCLVVLVVSFFLVVELSKLSCFQEASKSVSCLCQLLQTLGLVIKKIQDFLEGKAHFGDK